MTLINVFAFSAVVMAFMLSFRLLEIKIGHDIISRNFRKALDELIVDIWKISVNWLQNTRKKFFYELKKIPIFVLHVLIAFWGFALRKTLKAVSLVQGRIDSRVKSFVQEHLEEIEKN
jgi:flagellar motor component MotA